MHKHSIVKKVLIIALVIFAIIAIVFMALITISASYLYGWIFSASVSIIGYLFGLYALKIIMKHKSKSFGIFLWLTRIVIAYVLHIVAIVILVWVDKSNSGLSFFGSRGISSVYEPINIFTYLSGVAIIPISTLIAHLPFKKGR